MVIIYAFAKSSYFLSGWWQTWRTDTKKKDVLVFLLLLSDVNGWYFHLRPPGGRTEGSTDLIAPRDSSQAGGLSRLATLPPLNARSVHGSASPPRQQLEASSQSLVQTRPALKLVHRPHSFIHPCFFSRGRNKRLKPKETSKRGKRSINRKMLLAHSH